MKQIRIGTFQLGHRNVELFAVPEDFGGEFYFAPDRKSIPRIKVGLDAKHWDECVTWLLHETIEFSMCDKDLRFAHSGKSNYDTGDFCFHFDHSQFGRICSDVAIFMTAALPELSTAYRKYRKGKR